MKFSIFQVSRKGGRKNNEDRMGYCYTRNSSIFFLADGMGGHPQGEVAAQLALQTISTMFQKEAQPALADVAEFLETALIAAHHQIVRYGADKAMLDTPRTTLVMAVVQAGVVSWIHCGDSRLYLMRQDELLTRTRDHSFLEQRQAAAAGLKLPEHMNRNVLFTCLGSPVNPLFEVSSPVTLQQGDKLMLCSDGLWGSLSDAEILEELRDKPVSQSVPDLVERALSKAGKQSDNVTCIAMEWETPDGFESTRGDISTASDGVFASTVQMGQFDDDLDDCDDLDDAAIERSIAEINEAIRRSAIKKI